MKNMKWVLWIFATLFATMLLACSDKGGESGEELSPPEPPTPNSPVLYEGHPRILLADDEVALLKATISSDPLWSQVHSDIISEAATIESKPVLTRVLEGRRLLSVSREAIRRIFFWSYAYRMDGKFSSLTRAEKEIRAVCQFTDWNPSHFLDVAEMTMAVSIGYDWLYDRLSQETRDMTVAAIRDKGLKPSLDPNLNKGFLNAKTNWSQVCHGGLAFGALALLEEEPELAQQILDRSAEKMAIPMAEYAPDGAYPEGIGYWDYGTSFNVLYLSAIEKAFEANTALENLPGFMETGMYSQQMITSMLQAFSYADNGSGVGITPATFWFYTKTQDPALLYMQKRMLQAIPKKTVKNIRYAPALLIWGAGTGASLNNAAVPTNLFYLAQGVNPVCVMRSAWDNSNALYVGFKAGIPKVNHGHMDVGSFILEADGIRWGIDFGSENYNTIEQNTTHGKLFNMAQDSPRWDIFRYNNWAHNTLTFNDGRKQQLVEGQTIFSDWSDDPNLMYATVDLTPVYSDVQKAERGVAMVDKSYVMVEDVITTKNEVTKVRWNMTTAVASSESEVGMDAGNNLITLTSGGKNLYLKVVCDEPVTLKTWPTAPATSYENKNTGTLFVGFEANLPANTTTRLKVYLMPGAEVNDPLEKIFP